MRWYAQYSTTDKEFIHPSYANAWKHFQNVHSNFNNKCMNMYIGLCTCEYSLFGMSDRKYPCASYREVLQSSIVYVHAKRIYVLKYFSLCPKHQNRSLNVSLHSMIHELKQLWYINVRTFDYSQQRNFIMRAMLMWTINDFSYNHFLAYKNEGGKFLRLFQFSRRTIGIMIGWDVHRWLDGEDTQGCLGQDRPALAITFIR